MKAFKWIMSIGLLVLAIPFLPNVFAILVILVALAIMPSKKLAALRGRIFKRKEGQAQPAQARGGSTEPKRRTETKPQPQNLVTFGPWEVPEAEYFETVARMDRARQIPDENVDEIDMDSGTTTIIGSTGDEYTVSLSYCDCMDFARRGLPCKHMIRMALELDLSFEEPVFDPDAAAEHDIEEDIKQLTERWRAGQLTGEALAKCVKALRASASQAKKE